MPKTLLCFFFFLTLSSAMSAQFRVDNSFAAAQGTANETLSPTTSIRNLSNKTLVLHWEIAKKNLPSGWSFMVNDRPAGDKGVLTLAPGETFADFKVNFQANGAAGIGNVELLVFDPAQRTSTETVLHFTASATPAAAADALQVFPNPASDYISISSAQGLRRIEILNTLGRKVLEFQVQGENERYNISELQRGMYFVRMIDQHGATLRTQRISKYNP